MKLLQKILVPVDFTESSKRAVETAIQLARSFDSHITLLHVASYGITSEDAEELLKSYTLEKLEELTAHIRKSGVKSTDFLVHEGVPFEKIIDVAQYSDYNVIIAGSGNKGDDETYPLGTTVEKLIRKNQVPLWVVKNSGPLNVQSIVCPVDFSDASARALRNAITLADAFNAKLTVLNVYKPIDTVSPRFKWIDTVSENRYQREQQQKEFQAFLDSFNLETVDHEILRLEGEPHVEILKIIQERKFELLVMGTVGKSGLSRLLMGSVTEKVTRTVPCSFITAKSGDLTVSFMESSIRNIEEILECAASRLDKGNPEAAIEMYITGLRQYPDNIPLLKGLIASCKSTGNLALARKYSEYTKEVIRRTWGKEYLSTLSIVDGDGE